MKDYYVVIADDDSSWQQALSPRYHSHKTVQERLVPFLQHLAEISEAHGQFVVALTVEELCPGGLDPTDGIIIAQACEAAGASAIIASGGTADFPALKWRRPTQRKATDEILPTNEPWLASAAWLLGRVSIPVYAKGHAHDQVKAAAIAQQMGFAGVF